MSYPFLMHNQHLPLMEQTYINQSLQYYQPQDRTSRPLRFYNQTFLPQHTIRIMLTSPVFRCENFLNIDEKTHQKIVELNPDPIDMLNKNKCLQSATEIRTLKLKMKRSYSSLHSYPSKRSKTINNSITTPKNLPSLTSNSLTFFIDKSKNSFINYLHMPPIIFKHQLYSLKSNNRTLIDCELQDMFNNNQIRLFHSDFGVMLMFINDYNLLIERQLNENNLSSLSIEKNRLKQRFIQDLLPKYIRLSIDKIILENEFKFNSNDIHLLIQLGLLLPKQIDQYWFSIPNLASFITCLEKGRRTLLQMLSRRTYREIPINEFRLRDTKNKCLLGFDYHIHDLIGANLAHIIDTPTGSIVKIGPEKA